MIYRNLNQLINWFTPRAFLEQTLSNDLMRARVLVIMLFWSIPNTLAALIPVFMSDDYHSANRFQAVVVIASITTLYTFCLFFFKHSASLATAANMFICSAFLGVTVPGLMTGGLESGVTTPLMLAMPVLGFLIAGKRWGMFWTIGSGLSMGGFFIADRMGVIFPNALGEDVRVLTYFLVWETALVMITACLFIYESQLQTLTKKIEAQTESFAYQATHDQLTGLCNRALFTAHAKKAIDFALAENLKAAIIYIDLDDFKPINDTHGHHVGDEVLQISAQRLRQAVRSSDSVARLGGDEFAVLLHGAINRSVIAAVAEKILYSLRSGMEVDGLPLQVSASMGVIIIPDDGTRLDLVLKLADGAMYQAKKHKNKVHYYQADKL